MNTEFELAERLREDTIYLVSWRLCDVLLMNDQQFPWFILVPRVSNITELYQLTPEDQAQFWLESNHLSKHVMQQFNGEKLNLAALGNVVPQLHVHHIVRFKADKAWPGPVWGKIPPLAYTQEQLAALKEGGRRWMEFIS